MEIRLGSIVSYVVGILLAFTSLLLSVKTPLGLVPFLVALLIIPVVRREFTKRTGIKFSRGAVAGIGVFGVIAGLIVLILVGFSGSGGSFEGPGADVSNVSVKAEDSHPPDAVTSLDILWNSRAQSGVDPDPDNLATYNADEGQKFLVVKMSITNSGNERIDLDPDLFRINSEGVEYEYQRLFGSGNSFSGVALNPGASYSGWTAFSVPDDTVEAKLIVHQDAYYQKNVSVSFSHNRNMAINVSD